MTEQDRRTAATLNRHGKGVYVKPPSDDPIDVALAYYRQHTGPATREDIKAAADPRRSWHTLAELRALQHAGLADEHGLVSR
jgi:hypothetical protein